MNCKILLGCCRLRFVAFNVLEGSKFQPWMLNLPRLKVVGSRGVVGSLNAKATRDLAQWFYTGNDFTRLAPAYALRCSRTFQRLYHTHCTPDYIHPWWQHVPLDKRILSLMFIQAMEPSQQERFERSFAYDARLPLPHSWEKNSTNVKW